MSAEDTEVNKNIKYLVVGIDSATGSFVYITGDDEKIKDTATREYVPYSVIENTLEPTNENMQYVKIKVQKSSIKPVFNDKNPSFELNKNWYTLLLDQFVNPLETSGVVDKNWFADYGLDKSPFDIFKRFVYTNLVETNLKYLLNLSPEDTDFLKVFPDVETNKNGTFEQIRTSLVKPFFAVKTVIDMWTAKEEIENGKKVLKPGFFVNYRDRYGYPNISGDKSHIISALQLLHDVRKYCDECINQTAAKNLFELLQHIKNRMYFLRKNETDLQITDFDNSVKPFITLTEPRNYPKECWTFLNRFLNNTSIELKEDAELLELNKNMLIVYSDKPVEKKDQYELIGEICKLKDVDQYIYICYKENLVFNDVEIRKLTEDQRLVQWCEDKRIRLYRKMGSTYRDFLKSKFFISDEDIDLTLKGNRTIEFVDRFYTNDSAKNNKVVDTFMRQYLSDSSRLQLYKLINTPFTGERYRHGICNFDGEISGFIAAMQLAYDCILRSSKIDFARQQSGTSAGSRSFEYQLLNSEYCLGRIFNNIQASNEVTYRPLETFIQVPNGGGRENVFENYKTCVNFILRYLNYKVNTDYPDNPDFKPHPEYKKDNIMNNLFYKLLGVLGFNEQNLKYVFADICVKTLHKVIPLLFTEYNVLTVFEDDYDNKFKNFTAPNPNFVIKIGSLPRKIYVPPASGPAPAPASGAAVVPVSGPIAAPIKNWLELSGFDAFPNFNGLYEPIGETYLHIMGLIQIQPAASPGTGWQFYNTIEKISIANRPGDLIGVGEITSGGTTYNNITIKETGAPYTPQSGDKPDINISVPEMSPMYEGPNTTNYKRIGTIFKSIHHDYYYSYYNYEHKILLSDCNAVYDLQEPNLPVYTTNKDMFEFITLYRRVDFDSKSVKKEDLIYQDVITFMATTPI